MQRMGGGGCPCSGGLLKGGSKQRGGGNNPSCGCDMQAGWPSASVLPRGGTTMQSGGSGSDPVCGSCPFPGTGACPFYARGGSSVGSLHPTTPSQRGGKRGGGCGCGGRSNQQAMMGGGCSVGCAGPTSGGLLFQGGYRATRRNKKYLNKWRKGKSIGFTMLASLKAKGLIPRTSKTMKGKRVVSRKYKH